MATSPQLSDVECEKNPGHKVFTPLSQFTHKHLPRSYRSLHNWALICTKAPLSVRLEVKTTGSGAASCLDCSGSGCIVGVDGSHPDKISLTVQTAAHLWYGLGKDTITTLFLFIQDSGEVLESNNVELKTVKNLEDIVILKGIFYKHNCVDPNINRVLSDIQKALRPNFDTLYQLVLRKYQTVSLTLSSFLKDEIRCLEGIKFASDKLSD